MWFDVEIPEIMQSVVSFDFSLPSSIHPVLYLVPGQSQISEVKYISITVLTSPLSCKDKLNFTAYNQIQNKYKSLILLLEKAKPGNSWFKNNIERDFLYVVTIKKYKDSVASCIWGIFLCR